MVVRGENMRSGERSHACLHLVDLAGSERVGKSEAAGEGPAELGSPCHAAWHTFAPAIACIWQHRNSTMLCPHGASPMVQGASPMVHAL